MNRHKPNIILICFDQMGACHLPVYGNKIARTPHLDSLASRSAVFVNAVTASPVCGPARASLITGLYPSSHGVWTNDLLPRPGTPSVAEKLSELGYLTASVGKMHFTPTEKAWGFSYNRRTEDIGRAKKEPEKDGYLCHLKEKGIAYRAFKNSGPADESALPFEEHQDTWVANEAIRFLEMKKEKPFFLNISFVGPHDPVNPPAPFHQMFSPGDMTLPLISPEKFSEEGIPVHYRHRWGIADNYSKRAEEFQNETFRKYIAHYFGYIAFLDAQVGRLLESLKHSGQAENTHVVFTTDHGEMLGKHGMREKGPWGYDESLRIPLFISGPGVVPGRVTAPVSGVDLASTFLEWSGGEQRLGQGFSLAALSCGDSEAPFPRELTVSEFNNTAKMVRDKRYSYIYYPAERRAELYDREKDPDQLQNLAGRTEVAGIENRFLKEIVEFEIGQKASAEYPVPFEAKDISPRLARGFSLYAPYSRIEEKDFHLYLPGSSTAELKSWFA